MKLHVHISAVKDTPVRCDIMQYPVVMHSINDCAQLKARLKMEARWHLARTAYDIHQTRGLVTAAVCDSFSPPHSQAVKRMTRRPNLQT